MLAEVGNVIPGSCVSSFGDMLQLSVSFSVPRMHVQSLEGLLRWLPVDDDAANYVLLAGARFRLTEGAVGGILMISVGMRSLSLIARALAARDE